jgi:hypothetical protein
MLHELILFRALARINKFPLEWEPTTTIWFYDDLKSHITPYTTTTHLLPIPGIEKFIIPVKIHSLGSPNNHEYFLIVLEPHKTRVIHYYEAGVSFYGGLQVTTALASLQAALNGIYPQYKGLWTIQQHRPFYPCKQHLGAFVIHLMICFAYNVDISNFVDMSQSDYEFFQREIYIDWISEDQTNPQSIDLDLNRLENVCPAGELAVIHSIFNSHQQ